MIGVFDSGVGGLTVVREIKKALPHQPILYVGDTARVPWGNKNPEIIQRYSEQICNFIISQKISTIIIACNTASAVAGDVLRKKFKDVKFYDVVAPAVKRICESDFSRVAVIGTRATIGSGVYEKKISAINKRISVFSQACPLFVPLVEEGWKSGQIPEMIAKKYFKSFKKKNIEAMVLGCTHYPLLCSMIKKVAGENVEIVNCATEIAKMLKKETKNKPKEDRKNWKRKDKFFLTDASDHHRNMVARIMGAKIKILKISFDL